MENDECYTYAEFKWIDDRDSFLEYVEHYAENGYPFDEFQQIVLDEFVNALNDVDLEMIRKWYEECLEK